MRTDDDLTAAFRLLERYADAAADADTDPVLPDRLPTGRSAALGPSTAGPGRFGPWTRIAAVATAAAAVVAVALVVGHGADGPGGTAPGGTAPDPVIEGNAPRSFDVTVDPAAGLSVAEVSTDPLTTEVVLVSRTAQLDLDLLPGDLTARVTPGLPTVDINGVTGYYSDGTQSPVVEASAAPGSSTPAPPTPTPPETRYARAVVWPLGTHRYARVLSQGSIPDESELVRVARAIRVGAAQPIRTAVLLGAAPPGLHLSHLTSTYHAPGDNPPFDVASTQWATMLRYAPAAPGNAITVEATSVDITADWHGGEALIVDGHPAYWSAAAHRLDLDAGHGAYVVISEAADYGAPLVSTRDQFVAIARTLEVSADPTRPTTWFAATDLP